MEYVENRTNDKTSQNVAVRTIGCRLNQADTALIFGRLKNAGYNIVKSNNANLDVVIVNSCAVTASASQKSRQAVRAFRGKHPQVRIIVTGCGSNVEKESWEKEPADIVLPNTKKFQIVEYVERLINRERWKRGKKIQPLSGTKRCDSAKYKIFKEKATAFFPFKTRAFLKIQDGCDSFCTYCIVPYARGRERSRTWDEIIPEAMKLLEDGHKEIILTGVNISAYRHNNRRLSDLVAKLADIPGNFRIRLSSMEPHPENRNILDLIENNSKICRFLHIPLQHGSDTILKSMGRNYNSMDFADFTIEAAERIPDIHIGTDVIVGFPGETEVLFNESCEFIKKLPFANLHIFRFSPRKRTPAMEFRNQVPQRIAKERCRRLMKIKEKSAEKFLSSQTDKILSVLIEKKVDPATFEGWSDNYIRVRLKGKNLSVNSLVQVQITGKASNTLLEGGFST